MNFGHLGFTELLIVMVILIIMFGGGRIARLGGELGTAIRDFRRNLKAGDEQKAD